jgi:hypothetical protein
MSTALKDVISSREQIMSPAVKLPHVASDRSAQSIILLSKSQRVEQSSTKLQSSQTITGSNHTRGVWGVSDISRALLILNLDKEMLRENSARVFLQTTGFTEDPESEFKGCLRGRASNG